MREKRGIRILGCLAVILIFFAFNINVQAEQSVTILLDGVEQRAYTTIQLGDQLEIVAMLDGEEVREIQWVSDESDVVSVEKDRDTSFLKANKVGKAVIKATIVTEHDELSCELLVYTRMDPEQMVYLEDESEQLTDDEYTLKPRAAGDVTLYINGEVRRTYNTIGVSDTRTAMIEVEGEVIQKIDWSSSDNSVVSISGDKDGATILAISEGIATITADITTDQGKRSKDLIISTRTDVSLIGYANATAEMHQAANEESNINGNISKGDQLDIRGMNGKYYWVYHDDAYGFILKSKVDIPVVSLSLPESVTIHKGESDLLKVQIFPIQSTDQRLIWSSDNKSIVKVDSNGKITGVKKGIAYIQVKTFDGKIAVECKVEVKENSINFAPLSTVKWDPIIPSYSSIQVKFYVKNKSHRDFKYHLEFTNTKTKKKLKTKEKYTYTNSWEVETKKGLDYNTRYKIKLVLTYLDEGTTWSTVLGTKKTKKPKVSLSVNKQSTSFVQLKMKATPNKFYDSYRIRYKVKGKKYTAFSKKKYNKKGNLIKIKNNPPIGKTAYYELGLYKKGKLICKDTVKIKKGHTTVNTKIDKDLSRITVSWKKIDFAKGYYIYRSEEKEKLGKKIKTITKAKTTSYTDWTSYLKNPQKYYYQVRPYWKEGKKKKTGTSNRSGIQARKIDPTVNNRVLRENMGLDTTIMAGSTTNINKFFVQRKGVRSFPAIKYQFDGKQLTIHLYIKYASYYISNTDKNTGQLTYKEESLNTILSWRNTNGLKYVDMFEQGLKKYYGNQVIKGTGNDFGKDVNFKVALAIHRQDDKRETYEPEQQFIEAVIGGIYKYSFSKKEEFDKSVDR